MSEIRQSTDPGFGQEDDQPGNNYMYMYEDILSPGTMEYIEKCLSSPSVSRTPYHSDAAMKKKCVTPSESANIQTSEAASLPMSDNSTFAHKDTCIVISCLSTAEEVCLDCYASGKPKLCNRCFRQRHPNHAKKSTLSTNAFFNIAQKTKKERNAAITPLSPSYRALSTAATRENNMGTRSEAAKVYKYVCFNAVMDSFCEGVATVMCIQCHDYNAILLCHRCDERIHTSDSSGHVRVPLKHLTQAGSPEELTVDTGIVLQNNTRRGVHICTDCEYPADMVCLDCENKICFKICSRHVGAFHKDIWSTFHYRIKLSDGTRIPSLVNGSPKTYICRYGHCKAMASLVCLDCHKAAGLFICQTCDDFLHGDRLSSLFNHRRIPVQHGTSEEQSVSSHRGPPQSDIGIRVNNEEDNSGATLSARSVDAHTMTDAVDGTNCDTNSETEMEDGSADEVESTYICHFKECKQKADVVCLTCANKKPHPMVLYCSKCYVNKHGQEKHNSIQLNKNTNELRAQTSAEASVTPPDDFAEIDEIDVVSGAGDLTTPPIQQPEPTPQTSNMKRRASAASVKSLYSIHERYAKVYKRVTEDGVKLRSAYANTGVAKQTLLDRVGIAELRIIDPQKYQELEEEYRKRKAETRPTVKQFETRCREVIKTCFLEKVRTYRKNGKLLNLKTKAYD